MNLMACMQMKKASEKSTQFEELKFISYCKRKRCYYSLVGSWAWKKEVQSWNQPQCSIEAGFRQDESVEWTIEIKVVNERGRTAKS